VGGVKDVWDKIFSPIKSMYEEIMVCVRIVRKLGRIFKVDVVLQRGCDVHMVSQYLH
jgi:hypothetical protein